MGPFAQIHLGRDRRGVALVVKWILALSEPTYIPAHGTWPRLSDALLAAQQTETHTIYRHVLMTDPAIVATSVHDLPFEIADSLYSAEDILMTVSIGVEELRAIAPLLLDLAKVRKGSSRARSTAIVAPEHLPGPLWDQLSLNLGRLGVDCRQSMVHRLHTNVPTNEPEVRDVIADTDVEWLVEGAPTAGALQALSLHPAIRFVSDLTPYRLRKDWLLHGMRLALAIVARDDLEGAVSLREAAASPVGAAWLTDLQGATAQSLEQVEVVLPDTRAYAAEQFPEWVRREDDISLVLGRLQRADLAWFLVDVERLIGKAARAARKAGGGLLPEAFQITFDALHNLLLTSEQHSDSSEVASGLLTLSADADHSAAHRYALLLRGVLPPAEANIRFAEAVRIWARQRDDRSG